MRRREPLHPDAARELDALDAALRGGPVAEQDAELAQLATALVAERPRSEAPFAAELDERVAARFPPRARAAAAESSSPGARRARRGATRPSLLGRLPRPAIPTLATTLAVALLTLLIALDTNGGGGGGTTDGALPAGGAAMEAPSSSADSAAPEAASKSLDSAGGAVANPAPEQARKVERSSTLELGAPADRVDDVAQDVLGVVARHRGIVDRSSVATGAAGGEADFELRIPATRLSAALAQLSDLPDARVLARTDDAVDVNQAYVSVRRRIANAEALRDGLLRALRAADTEAETDRLRARLADVEGFIARLERGRRALDRRVDYAQVALTVRADERPAEDDGGAFTPSSALDDAGRVLAVTAGVIVIAAAVLVPFALLALIAWPLARAARRRRREQALDAA